MKKSSAPRPDGDPNQWLAFLNLGWMIVANMVLFVGLGMWLDRKFRTAPWLLLTGVFFAFVASGYTIYLAVKRLESSEREKPRQSDPAQSIGPS